MFLQCFYTVGFVTVMAQKISRQQLPKAVFENLWETRPNKNSLVIQKKIK